MMPGPHVPPAVPMHPGRRQQDYHYQYPPQAQSPVPHNPYAGYYHPPYPAHTPQYPQQWHPQYHMPQHYVPPPRQYPPQHAPPVVVSSQMHTQSIPLVNRHMVHTPPIVHSRTPPVVPTSTQTPQPAPSTPSVISQALVSPGTPATGLTEATPPPRASSTQSSSAHFQLPSQPQDMDRPPFELQLPWLSHPDEPFPRRVRRRRKRREAPIPDQPLELPTQEQAEEPETAEVQSASQTSTVAAASEAEAETPATSLAPSETDSTHPTTPSSAAAPPTPSARTHTRTATKPVVPLIPIKPAVPKKTRSGSTTSVPEKPASVALPQEAPPESASTIEAVPTETLSPASERTAAPTSPPVKDGPKSWADLVRPKASGTPAAVTTTASGSGSTNGFAVAKSGSLSDVLSSYSVDSESKIAFLEPRGLVNTGNMCYMNSILQTLVFCIPFYDFLDQVRKRAAHSFNSETPLVDAMIIFMREFNVIDSAVSAEQLRLRLKDTELEQYGEAFIPEFVYDVIKRLPRFASMRRGHQQDAEEFLGFLLAGMHEECVHVMRSQPSGLAIQLTSPTNDASASGEGWLEVGPKQKAAVTRTSGHIETESPVTKIFGGKLRSELRVPGLKNSVTLEPYQPLQLDIGDAAVNNITDALKHLTHSETLHGDFNSPRGPGTTAAKQVFIESLPPVLILHLKRFQYDNTGGTQKIWKKVGYPLELEIPKEVFPLHKRNSFAAKGGLPRYRLIGVVYHHGKNASGGHYTVDVRRQEGREWIRMDDTVIRRVRSEDVAEGGSEEDPKLLAKALEQHKRDESRARNMFEGMDEEDNMSEGGWNQVNGNGPASNSGGTAKKWSGVVNGAATPSTTGKRTPRDRGGFKDNKVAYILFYQQIKN